MRNAADQRALRIKGIMQKLAGSVPRPTALSGVAVMSLRGVSPDSLATLALRGALRSLRGVFGLRQPVYADKDNSTQ